MDMLPSNVRLMFVMQSEWAALSKRPPHCANNTHQLPGAKRPFGSAQKFHQHQSQHKIFGAAAIFQTSTQLKLIMEAKTHRGPPRRGQHSKRSESREVQISKALSKLLRHQAANAGVPLDQEGYAPLDRVVRLVLLVRPKSVEREADRKRETSCNGARSKVSAHH